LALAEAARIIASQPSWDTGNGACSEDAAQVARSETRTPGVMPT
jgi:hypothetical protein